MINCLLYDCKADVDAMTFDEVTPLHVAAGRGMESVVALLLAAGADPRLTNYEGESPKDVATSHQVITKEAFDFKYFQVKSSIITCKKISLNPVFYINTCTCKWFIDSHKQDIYTRTMQL